MLLFARTFLKEPKLLGSFIPSSRFLTNRLLKNISWERARTIVEFGPGVGNISVQILRRMRKDASLLCIEASRDLAAHVDSSSSDARLKTIHGTAEDVQEILRDCGHSTADYIISGIPFSTMPERTRDAILLNSYQALSPGGEMLVYQFSGAVLPYLKRIYGVVIEEREPLNVFPAHIFRCVKPKLV